jgi:hypothetical protein
MTYMFGVVHATHLFPNPVLHCTTDTSMVGTWPQHRSSYIPTGHNNCCLCCITVRHTKPVHEHNTSATYSLKTCMRSLATLKHLHPLQGSQQTHIAAASWADPANTQLTVVCWLYSRIATLNTTPALSCTVHPATDGQSLLANTTHITAHLSWACQSVGRAHQYAQSAIMSKSLESPVACGPRNWVPDQQHTAPTTVHRRCTSTQWSGQHIWPDVHSSLVDSTRTWTIFGTCATVIAQIEQIRHTHHKAWVCQSCSPVGPMYFAWIKLAAGRQQQQQQQHRAAASASESWVGTAGHHPHFRAHFEVCCTSCPRLCP